MQQAPEGSDCGGEEGEAMNELLPPAHQQRLFDLLFLRDLAKVLREIGYPSLGVSLDAIAARLEATHVE